MNVLVMAACVVAGIIGGSGVLDKHSIHPYRDWRVGVVVGVPLGALIGWWAP